MRSVQKSSRYPKFDRGEIKFVALLVGIGLVGGWMAKRQLGALRSELEQVRLHGDREIARLRADNHRLQQQETASGVWQPVSPASAEPAAISRAERMMGLLQLAQVVSLGHRQGSMNRQQQSTARVHARAIAAGADLPEISQPAYLVSPDGRLPARFGELFMLNDDRVTRLQQTLDAAKVRIEELALAHARIQDHGNGTYSIETPGVPEALIAADRERMIGTFKQELGEDGYRAFALLNGETSDRSVALGGPATFFELFGAVGPTVAISKTSAGKYRYEMRRGASGVARGEAATREELQASVGVGVRLLPSGF
jgi:hypothetical protein